MFPESEEGKGVGKEMQDNMYTWTYCLKLRLGVKAGRVSFIVLYFWRSFVNFLIFMNTSLREEKAFQNLF